MAMRDLIPFGRQQGITTPSLWRESEFSPLASFRREMDRLFNDLTSTPAFSRFGEFGGLTANWTSIDVQDKDNELLVTAEVPGLTDKDIELFVDNGILTLRGEKKREKEERGYTERFFGKFERQILLPSGGVEAHGEADFRGGVRAVDLPMPKE